MSAYFTVFRTIATLIGILVSVSTHASFSLETNDPVPEIDTFLVNDLNSDGIKDTAFIYKPAAFYDDYIFSHCTGDSCDITIRFSCNIPPIFYSQSLGGEIFALEDLNGDGNAEILLKPEWFIGSWTTITVYSFQQNKWIKAGTVRVFTSEEENYSYAQRVRRINKHTFSMTGDKMDRTGGKRISYRQKFDFRKQSY